MDDNSDPLPETISHGDGLVTFSGGSGIDAPTRRVSISIGKVPPIALKDTQQELIFAHGVGDIVQESADALQDSEYGSRDAQGRVTTTFVIDNDDLIGYASCLQDLVRELSAPTNLGLFNPVSK